MQAVNHILVMTGREDVLSTEIHISQFGVTLTNLGVTFPILVAS